MVLPPVIGKESKLIAMYSPACSFTAGYFILDI
jgi:hypothetical protein